MCKMKQIKNNASPQDLDVWEEFTKGIKPLPVCEVPPQAPLIIDEINPKIDYGEAYHGAVLENLTIGNFPNVDKRTSNRFRKGEMPLERRLDLHGYTEKEAYEKVLDFIKEAYLSQCRCVLIITGKGLKKDDDELFSEKGILRERVPQWLNTPDLRPLILGMSYALPKDGGEGALYVLLRRKKSLKPFSS